MFRLQKLSFLFLILTIFFSLNVFASRDITFGVHPFLKSSELVKRFSPLINYLSEKTGFNIKLRIAKNYKEHIKYVGEDRITLAYLGPTPYIEVCEKYGPKVILGAIQVNGEGFFSGNIFTKNNSSLKTLSDLKGKRFAFVDKDSTMGYSLPMHIFLHNGLNLKSFSEYSFLGSHNNVILGVLIGDYDAGAVKEDVYANYQNRGLRELNQGPIQAKSPTHVFLATKSYPYQDILEIKRALYSLNNDPELKILKSIKKSITGIIDRTDIEFDELRSIIKEVKKNEN